MVYCSLGSGHYLWGGGKWEGGGRGGENEVLPL
jgi:hypothetical protein